MKQNEHTGAIPVSPALSDLEEETSKLKDSKLKNRLLRISWMSIAVAIAVSFIAKFLVWLINVVTNIAFYGVISGSFHSPSANHLGWWVVVIPAIGGIIVGLMAWYGSAAIR